MLNERPVMRARTPAYVVRRRRRWDEVSWWFSLLFVIPMAIIAISTFSNFSFSFGGTGSASSGKINVTVTDAYSGKPISAATVSLGGLQVVTDGHGHAQLMIPDGATNTTLTVQGTNYEPVYGQVDEQTSSDQSVALRPTLLAGTLKDSVTGDPIAGAVVSTVSNPSDGDPLATTDANGAYALTGVPAGAKLYVDAGDYGTYEEDIAKRTQIDVAMKKSLATGDIIDDDGNPVAGATVKIGRTIANTNDDGHFKIAGASPGDKLKITSAGYEDAEVEVPAEGSIQATLKTQMIKAIYITGASAANPDKFNELVKLVDDTELNAVVLDVKQDQVYYDTQVQFWKDLNELEPVDIPMVNPLYDVNAYVKELHDHGIYAIARMVVFKDPLVAQKREDLAIKDDRGGIFHDANDYAWVDATNQELGQANIDLAVEAANIGFDEIQYDYIRLPSDNIEHADFPFDWQDEAAREKVITDFVKKSYEAIQPTGAKFSIDIFGIIAVTDWDQKIGQNFKELAPYVDYLCPMIYPSHFDSGFFNEDDPNTQPYETIKASMEAMKEQIPGMEKKLRPWLQDFSADWVDDYTYTAKDVKAQIKATREEGASGWSLWNIDNSYTEDALKPAKT
jgi:hypothetical protein